MRKLSVFLLLPLLSLPLRVRADRRARMGEIIPRDPARGSFLQSPHFLHALVRRCLSAPRRLLSHTATVQEIHVIAAVADLDVIETTPPAKRAGVRSITRRILPATPRVRPQTT
jgi:hypothetical protein